MITEFLEKFGLLIKGQSRFANEDGGCKENVRCDVCDEIRGPRIERLIPKDLVPSPSQPLQVTNKSRNKISMSSLHSVTCENKNIQLAIAYVQDEKAVKIQLFVNSCLVDQTYMRTMTGSFWVDGYLDFGNKILPIKAEVTIPFWTKNIIRISVNDNVIYEAKVFGF